MFSAAPETLTRGSISPGRIPAGGPGEPCFRGGLEAGGVTGGEAARPALDLGPARAAARDLAQHGVVAHAGVEAQAGDHDEGVAGVRVDREPLALALLAP